MRTEYTRWDSSYFVVEEGAAMARRRNQPGRLVLWPGFARNSSNTTCSLFHSEYKKWFLSHILSCACTFLPFTFLKTMYSSLREQYTLPLKPCSSLNTMEGYWRWLFRTLCTKGSAYKWQRERIKIKTE